MGNSVVFDTEYAEDREHVQILADALDTARGLTSQEVALIAVPQSDRGEISEAGRERLALIDGLARLMQELLADDEGAQSEPAMAEHIEFYDVFAAACETERVDFEPIGMQATIGARWYIFHGKELNGYVVAQEGHAGSDTLSSRRPADRRVRYWTTPENIRQIDAWDLAVAFVTRKVRNVLAHEWSDATA